MARIRTIKPEFPHSESLGRVSRDARLLFVMLWTICDDEGRARANSRMLASLLFPYDDDAAQHIPEWLMELEREKCIRVYAIDDNAYLNVVNWGVHQKIDKPSRSRLPAPPEKKNRRERAANIREPSREIIEASSGDLGPRTKDLGMEGTSSSQCERAQTLLSRLCEILRIRLEDDPERLTWQRQIEEAFRDGLTETELIKATETARTNGKTSFPYIRAVAMKPTKMPEEKVNGSGPERTKKPSATDSHLAGIADLVGEIQAGRSG